MACRLGASAAKLCVAASRNNTQVAGLRSSAVLGKNYGQVPQSLRDKMKHFQLPNDLPIHLKGGPMDKLLYAVSAILCTVGVLECFRMFYVLSFPPVNKD